MIQGTCLNHCALTALPSGLHVKKPTSFLEVPQKIAKTQVILGGPRDMGTHHFLKLQVLKQSFDSCKFEGICGTTVPLLLL